MPERKDILSRLNTFMQKPPVYKPVWIVLIVLSLVLYPWFTIAQTTPIITEEDLDRLSKWSPDDIFLSIAIKKVEELIEPVVASLKQRSSKDLGLLNLLNRLNFTAEANFLIPPNARAVPSTSGGLVHVDVRFIVMNTGNARMIAVDMAGNEETRSIAANHKEIWQDSVINSILFNTSPPPFIFSYWELIDDPVEKKLIEVLSEEALQEFTAFIVLHEIGHHVLGHLKLGRTLPTTSRMLESEADKWALQRLKELDYPHDIVYRFMIALAEEDEFYERLLLPTDHSQRTHPSWRARAETLAVTHDINAFPSTPIALYCAIFARVVDEQSKQYHLEDLYLAFPRNPQDWSSIIGVVATNGIVQLATVEIHEGKPYIFCRDEDIVSTFIIHKLGKRFSEVELKATVLSEQKEYLLGTVSAFQQTFAPIYSRTIQGINLDAMLNTKPMAFVEDALNRLSLSAHIKTQLRKIIKTHVEEINKLWRNYMKGILSLSDFQEFWEIQEQLYVNQLKNILGTDGYHLFMAHYRGQDIIKTLLSLALQKHKQRAQAHVEKTDQTRTIHNYQHLRHDSKKLGLFELIDIVKKYDFYDRIENPNGADVVNEFEVQGYQGKKIIVDHSTRLMWQQSGSTAEMSFTQAKVWIENLNQIQYAGFNDWRLPTTEEAMTLIERGYADHSLYISGLFDGLQNSIWTGDYSEYFEYTKQLFCWSINFREGKFEPAEDGRNNHYVRAVRTFQ